MFLDKSIPYRVADMSLAGWGRREIEIAEKGDAGADGRPAQVCFAKAVGRRPCQWGRST